MKCVDCLFCNKLPKPVLGISYGSPSAEDVKRFTFTHECNLNDWYLDAEEGPHSCFIEKDEREQIEEARDLCYKNDSEQRRSVEEWEKSV